MGHKTFLKATINISQIYFLHFVVRDILIWSEAIKYWRNVPQCLDVHLVSENLHPIFNTESCALYSLVELPLTNSAFIGRDRETNALVSHSLAACLRRAITFSLSGIMM